MGARADAVSLRAVRAASGARDVAAPLGALAQLVATGIPVRRAAQMKAATREGQTCDEEKDPHPTTKLTRRPGTTTIFFIVCPEMNFWTFQFATASS